MATSTKSFNNFMNKVEKTVYGKDVFIIELDGELWRLCV